MKRLVGFKTSCSAQNKNLSKSFVINSKSIDSYNILIQDVITLPKVQIDGLLTKYRFTFVCGIASVLMRLYLDISVVVNTDQFCKAHVSIWMPGILCRSCSGFPPPIFMSIDLWSEQSYIDNQMWGTCGLSGKFLIGLEMQYISIG